MDESAIWGKDCMATATSAIELLQVQFFPKLHSHPFDYLLIVMTCLHQVQAVTIVQLKKVKRSAGGAHDFPTLVGKAELMSDGLSWLIVRYIGSRLVRLVAL